MKYAALQTRHLQATALQAPARSPGRELRIGAPNDTHEREADRVAEEVIFRDGSKRDWSLSRLCLSAPLQRKCSCGSGSASGECEECKKNEVQMVRRDATVAAGPAFAPPIVHAVLNSTGQPLDQATRGLFELKFGQDLSSVKVHSDASGARSADAIDARAYTVGEHVVMNTGQYAPRSATGLRLLAHELTHVLQQRGAGTTGPPTGAQEVEAHRAAEALGEGGRSFSVRQRSGIGIARKPQEPEIKLGPTVTPDIKSALIRKLFDARRDAPPAGIRQNAVRTFAVAAIISPDGIVSYESAYYDAGTEHAERQLLSLIAAKVQAGDTVAIAIDQFPCGPNRANCAGALGEFREDPQHGSMRVYTVRALRRDAPADTTPETATPEQMVGPKTAITREPEEKFLVESVEFRRVRLPMYSGPEAPESTPGSKASPTALAQAGDASADLMSGSPAATPVEVGEGGGTPTKAPQISAALVTTGTTAFAALLMALNLAERFGFLSDPLEKEERNKINQLFHAALSQQQWDNRVQELQPEIDRAAGNIFYNIAFRVVYSGHHSPYPKFPSQYSLKAVEIVSVDVSNEDKSGCGKLDPADRPNGSYSWEASTACTTSVKVRSGGQVRAEKRAQENAVYLEKLRHEGAKTATPQASASQTPNGPPLLPTPAPQQSEADPSFLPGAPGPGPLEKARAVVANFKREVLQLKSRGERLISSSPSSEQVERFKHAEDIWRTGALFAKNFFTDHGPDEGVRGMDDLINGHEYGGRLKQIREIFGG